MSIRIVIGGVALMLVGGIAWFVLGGSTALSGGSARLFASGAASSEPYVVPPLKNEYRNEEFRFALSVPEGFTVGELPEDEGGRRTILLQDGAGNGVQIVITPFPGDVRELTEAQVRKDIPDMRIANVQPVEIGESHRGLAFTSDNDAFGGESREVWFVFRGNLYQISTYARLDALLQTMFGTWRFF